MPEKFQKNQSREFVASAFQLTNPLMRYFLVLLLCINSMPIEAQTSKKGTEAIKGMVIAKRFVFHAQSATTTGGQTRQLSSSYLLTVLPDSIICELPYYGRLYQAPTNSQDNGISFTSSTFEFATKDHKKGGWDIKVKTLDVGNAPQLFLTIYPKGSASLRISCTDRQSISYIGIIQEISKK